MMGSNRSVRKEGAKDTEKGFSLQTLRSCVVRPMLNPFEGCP